jgi:hypothetical protein
MSDNNDYQPKASVILDAVPDSRLAIFLDNLRNDSDRHEIGLDLVESYARTTDAATLRGFAASDVCRLWQAFRVLAGNVLLGEGNTYQNLEVTLYDLGGSILDLEQDTAARELVARIASAEPVLCRLIADRSRFDRLQGGVTGNPDGLNLADFLPAIEETLDSEPEARLAISLMLLRLSENPTDAGTDEVCRYVRETDPATLTGQLADDVTAARRAIDIAADRIPLNGMTYWNLQCNIGGLGGSIYNFAAAEPARVLVRRIIAAVPALAAEIAAIEPDTAF